MDGIQDFSKGQFKDTAYLKQPPSTYREANHLRLLSASGQSYAIESMDGTLFSFQIVNQGYYPIGWATVDDTLIVLSTNNEGTGGNGEIGIVTIDPNTHIGVYDPLYNHHGLRLTMNHLAQSFIVPETNAKKRFYWTDNYNKDRSINYANPKLYDNKLSGFLVPGESYMVVKGRVEYPVASGVFYGPQEPTTVFLAVAPNITYTSTGSTKVIQFVDPATLDITPFFKLPKIEFHQWIAGAAFAGMYSFAAQFQNDEGSVTSWTYVTRPIHLATGIPGAGLSPYQAYQGEDAITNTSKGIRLRIDNIDTSFSRMRIVAIFYNGYNSSEPPRIIADISLSGPGPVYVDYTGSENLGILADLDLIDNQPEILTVKTIANSKSRMFRGNVKLQEHIEWDPSSATATPLIYEVPSDIAGLSQTPLHGVNSNPLSGHAQSVENGVTYILTRQWYEVTGGIIEYPTGSGNLYGDQAPAVSKYFQGLPYTVLIPLVHSFTVNTATPKVTGVIRVRQYASTYKYIALRNDWTDNKGMTVDHYLASFWRGQKYRFGVVCWSLSGNPLLVEWMMDYKFLDQYQSSGGQEMSLSMLYLEEPNFYRQLNLRHLGLTINNLPLIKIAERLNVPLADLPKHIKGFSIVRAPTDKTILAQGMLWPTMVGTLPTAAGLSTTYVSARPDIADNNPALTVSRRINAYMLYSPDVIQNFDNSQNIVEGDELNIVEYRSGLFGGNGTDIINPVAGTSNLFDKWYVIQGGPIANSTPQGTRNRINANQSLFARPNEEHFFNVTGQAFINSGIAGPNLIGLRTGVGAYSEFVYTENSEGSGTHLYGYGLNQIGQTMKPIVNLIRPNNTEYGGTSAAAKGQTEYLFIGHYQEFDDAFMAYLQTTNGYASGIEVWGGDAKITVWDLNRLMTEDSQATNKYSDSIMVPLESYVNTFLRQGRHIAKDRIQDASNGNGVKWTEFPEQFDYNDAYSTDDNKWKLPAKPDGFIVESEYRTRVYYSDPKILGENTDSFKQYRQNNLLDIEPWAGELTVLAVKDGRLFYFQKRAMGYLPVNERVTISDPLGGAVQLGEGGVLTRHDEINRFFGLQHQWALVETEDGFVWPDISRRSICLINSAGQLVEFNVIKGLHAFMHTIKGDIFSNDNPVIGKGIRGYYDPRYKEAVLVFKNTTVLRNEQPQNFSIVIDVLNRQFTGNFNGILPGMAIGHNDTVISMVPRYPFIKDNFEYQAGDVVGQFQTNYVALNNFVTSTPAVQPPLDPTHWTPCSQTDNVFAHNRGEVSKFYGVVHPSVFQFVIVHEGPMDKVFDNLKFIHSQQYWTDVKVETVDQVGEDLNVIASGSREYEYRNKAWYSTIPTEPNGSRMRGQYLLVTLTKDYRVNGNPTESINEKVSLLMAQTTFRLTR